MDLMYCERETLKPMDDFGLPGTRLSFRRRPEGLLATVVHYPGRMWRVFWVGGAIGDYKSETAAIQAVEQKFGI